MGSSTVKLLLVGFSGSGKSTVLEELRRSWAAAFDRFGDLDAVVAPAGAAAFIDRHGWAAFRDAEVLALEAQLRVPGSAVIALGAGAWERAGELARASENVQSCYLAAPFETCWERLERDPQERPLAREGKAAMRELYLRRAPLYEQANFKVDAAGSPGEVALAIARRLGLA